MMFAVISCLDDDDCPNEMIVNNNLESVERAEDFDLEPSRPIGE
ncbi:hypothetical protein [Winogradskyella sp. 4-2091]